MVIALVALSVTLGLQIFRVHFPLAFDLGESIGFIETGLIAIGTFAVSPLLAEPARRLLGPRNALFVALGGAAAARLLIQFLHPVPFWLTTASTALVLVGWTLLLISLRGRGREGSASFVIALLLGLSLDTALRVMFRTWDHAWQDGFWPIILTLALVVAIGALLPRVADRLAAAEHPRGGALAVLALGPFLFLQVTFLQSPAFAASQSRLSLPFAGALILAGDALAITAVAWAGVQRVSRLGVLAAGAGLIITAVLIRTTDGPLVGLVLMLSQPLAAALLAAAISRDDEGSTPFLTSSAVAGANLLYLGLAFGFLIHYESPLPFTNDVLPPVAALILAYAAHRGGEVWEGARTHWLLAAVPLLLIVVPATVRIAAPVKERIRGDGLSLRLVSYNIHFGVNTEGQVELEAIARAIEAQDPDVVMLQEVARGWPTNGYADTAAWMSARLEMPYVYGPAADHQLGNAIFSRLPILEVRTGRLPKAGGSMFRGYVWAVVDIGEGETVNLIDTHLQDKDENTTVRLRQIDVLLTAWGGTERTVLAGDMNDVPESEEVRSFLDAGFVSAQDEIGDPSLPTSWQDETRLDYVFGTADLSFSDFERPFTRASDHLPLAATVTLR